MSLPPAVALPTVALPALPPTVALFLGPYRNLTTLAAAVLHLHPRCQALNHAGARVLGQPGLDFLVDHSPDCFARFCQFALAASQGGRRGNYGGSITLSHAFDHQVMRALYHQRYGDTLVKPVVESIVWKESLFVARHLRERRVDVGALLTANPRLRFLLPVRNPLDCAESNLRTGHARIWRNPPSGDIRDTVADILGEIAWFCELARRFGEQRFLCFFEFEFDERLPPRLAAFLRLTPDARWSEDAVRCFDLKPGPEHDPRLLDWYSDRVARTFGSDPELAAKLQRVVDYRRAASASTQAR